MIREIILDERVRAAVMSLAAVGLGATLFLGGFGGLSGFFGGEAPPAVYATVALLAAGSLIPPLGDRFVETHPKRALMLFEFGVLAVIGVVAILTAASLSLAVTLAPDAKADPRTAESGKTVAAAVAAILTALIAAVSRLDGLSAAGKRAKRTFQARFNKTNYVDRKSIRDLAQSPAPIALQGLEGWGWEARWERARLIHDELYPPAGPR